MPNPRVILHATDFSQRSAYAFELARSLARAESAELVLLHVLPTIGDEAARKKAEHALTHLVKSDPMVEMRWAILAGEPAAKIVWMAKETSADLIVLAASGRTRWSAVFSQSVSCNVERRAPCPVVRVKTPETWLRKQHENQDRCVYCDAPTSKPVGSARFKNRTQIARHRPATAPAGLLESDSIWPQI